MAATAAELTCETLVQQIKCSRLNFILSETAYGVNISIKKRFLREFPAGTTVGTVKPHNLFNCDKCPGLIEENKKLQANLNEMKSDKENMLEVIKVLESKVDKAEKDAFKDMKEAQVAKDDRKKVLGDLDVLKDVINNHNKDICKNKNDLSQGYKTIKTRDKEIHNLTNKCLNQQNSIKNLKDSIKELKAAKANLDKELRKLKKKAEKTRTEKDENQNFNNKNEIDSKKDLSKPSPNPSGTTTSPAVHGSMSSTPTADSPSNPLCSSDSKIGAKELLEMKLEELNAVSIKLIEDVPEEELFFEAFEMTTFGLDWKLHQEIADCVRDSYL